MEDIIKKMNIEAEEYGDLHGQYCDCMMEDPDECNCEEMKQVKNLIKMSVEATNKWWCEMAQAHRKHCTPEGNKVLTRMMGKKNRS